MPRMLINLNAHWLANYEAYLKRAREARFAKFTIYQTYWPRAYRAISLFFHLLLFPLRIRARWATLITFHETFEFSNDPSFTLRDAGADGDDDDDDDESFQ